jgi:hypothetical protein
MNSLPFVLAEDKTFAEMFRKLRLPYRHQISNRLLDEEYDRVAKTTKEMISSSVGLTLILDGWTNVTRHSVINFVVSTTTGPVFYKNIETGLNIFNLVRTVIEEIGKEKCLPL